MPVPLVLSAITDGVSSVPHLASLLKLVPWVALLYVIKWFFQGTVNRSERNMHSKVVLITGGTSGIGAEVARDLAERGAQIVLLTQHPLNDPFLVDYIEDLRTRTSNELITAERVDLASLHSVRTFATKWIDNAPPRRLDMIILCANTLTPRGGKLESTQDSLEVNWGMNYLANFHLLSILSPAIRAQPPDREVRVIIASCVSYLGGELPLDTEAATVPAGVKTAKGKRTSTKVSSKAQTASSFNPGSAYATSKLALMTFALAFQKHLSVYARPDKQPMNARVLLVDPGFCRTPGMRRYLTWGSLFGLVLYLIMYPFWWMVLKSPDQGAQSFLYAAMEAEYGRGEGGWLIKECREVKFGRDDVSDESVQKELWEYSESMVQEAEKRGALARARSKKEAEEQKTAATAAKPKEQPGKQPQSRRSRKAG